MDISVGLAGIKTAMEIAKLIYESGTSLEQAETKQRMANILCALARAQSEMAQQQTEINELKTRIQVRESMEYRRPAYYRVDHDKYDGPFCQSVTMSKRSL